MLEFLAGSVLEAARGNDAANHELESKNTQAIHVRWLMTARDDLAGMTPRQVLLKGHQRIQMDIEHRSHQWSKQVHAVPALSTDTAAYRFGGFGIFEFMAYFDLIRALLAEAWKFARKNPRGSIDKLVEKLINHRDDWLQRPFEVYGMDLSVADMIESERRRMPLTSNGSHFDCDCPICRAEADGLFGSGRARRRRSVATSTRSS